MAPSEECHHEGHEEEKMVSRRDAETQRNFLMLIRFAPVF
jgi:hypothetical protein